MAFHPGLEPHCEQSPSVAERFRGEDVVKVLETTSAQRGFPKSIRVDNGLEFISKSLDWWADFNGVKLDFSHPGKLTDNAFIESFNEKFRMECLNQHWFLSLSEAQLEVDSWREEYNGCRPHSTLGGLHRTSSPHAHPGLGPDEHAVCF